MEVILGGPSREFGGAFVFAVGNSFRRQQIQFFPEISQEQAMRWFILVSFLLVGLGCGGGGPVKHVVRGSATLDGTPLAEGRIMFESKDQKSPSEMGYIRNGKYEQKVGPGNYVVRITSER